MVFRKGHPQMIENPTAFTLALQEKLANPEDYPVFEAMHDLQAAADLLATQITVINHLRARVSSADTLVELQETEISEHNIQLFNKEIEIFNLQTQFERLNTKGTNGID